MSLLDYFWISYIVAIPVAMFLGSYTSWLEGYGVTLGDLCTIVVFSAIPVVNIIVAVAATGFAIDHFSGKVILPRRNS